MFLALQQALFVPHECLASVDQFYINHCCFVVPSLESGHLYTGIFTGQAYPKDASNEFIIQKLNLLVVIDLRFILAFCMRNER